MATMLDDGYLKMLQGVTSLEELLRVTRGVLTGMPQFYYRAVTAAGEIREGRFEESDRAAVIRRIQDAGQIPIRAEPLAEHRRPLRALARWPRTSSRAEGTDDRPLHTGARFPAARRDAAR
jgi:hypothetical protein